MTHNLILSEESHQSFGFTMGSGGSPGEGVGRRRVRRLCIRLYVMYLCVCVLSSGEEGNGILCSDQWSWKRPIRWFDKQQGRPPWNIASGVWASLTVSASAYNHMRVCRQQNRKESGNTVMFVCVCVCVIYRIKRETVENCASTHANDHTCSCTWLETCVNTAHSFCFGFFFTLCIFTCAPLKDETIDQSNKMKAGLGRAAWNSLLFWMRWRTDVDKRSTWNITRTPAVEAFTGGLADSGHAV